jgi:hypothetical protein
VGVAGAAVLVLGVPGLYLLLFILTKMEQWLDAGTRPAGAAAEAAPGSAGTAPPGAGAGQARGALPAGAMPEDRPVPALDGAESGGPAPVPAAGADPGRTVPGVIVPGVTGEAA